MQFLLYCLCGGIGVVTDYCIYYLFLSAGTWYQAANILGYASGTLISFFLNRKFTFRAHDKIVRRLTMFFSVAVLGFITSAGLLGLFVHIFSLDPRIAKLLTLPAVVLVQFSLNRKITFKQTKSIQR